MSKDEDRADQEDQADRQDQADQEDRADQEDQANHDDQDGKGDRGRRGVQGLRGRPGADSESVEVLTGVLDDLRIELVGLRKDVQKERKGRRLSLVVIGVAFVIVTIVTSIGWVDYSRNNVSERNRANALRTEQVRRAYDLQVAFHESCISRNDARANVRDLFLSFYDLIGSTKPAEPRTPAEQAVIDGFVRQSRMDVQDKLPPVDCNSEAPLPKGKRP